MTIFSDDDDTTRLIQAIQGREGDIEELYAKLIKLYGRRVRSFFRQHRFSPEEARDLTQDVYLRVFTSIDSFRFQSRFETWLLEIADHVYQNELRRRGAAKRAGWEVSLDTVSDPFDPDSRLEIASASSNSLETVLERENAELLSRAIQALPDQMRTCFLLRYAQGRKYKEIAVIMKISIDTVKAHLFQAKKRLSLELASEDDRPTISRNVGRDGVYFVAAPSPPATTPRLSDLVERFLTSRHAESPHTLSAYRRHLQGFVRELGEEMPTATALARYHASLLRDGRGSTSHQQALAAVRGFLNWLAETENRPLHVPPPQTVRRLLKIPSPKEKPTSALVEDKEANALLQHAPTARDRAMVGVLLEAGLRVNELVRLEIEDFQNQGLLLHVRARKGAENRILPLSPSTADLVASYLHETARTWESSGTLFLPLPLRGGRAGLTGRLTTRAVEYRLRQILTAAGVTDKKISPNSLRQTYAVRYLQETGDLKTLQGLLGHASIGTTERYLRYIDSKKD